MAELCGSSCGLLFFSAMILRGLAAGNPPESILLRALAGLVVGFALGAIAGFIAERIVRENAAGKPAKDDSPGSKNDARERRASAADAARAA